MTGLVENGCGDAFIVINFIYFVVVNFCKGLHITIHVYSGHMGRHLEIFVFKEKE